MAIKLGMEAKLLFKVGGQAGGGAWVAMGNVKDVTLNLEAGEADVTTRANAGWRATVTYRFAGSPNVSGLSIGPITGIAKKGWEYLWVRYADQEDTAAKAIVKRPIAAYIERVYDDGGFAALDLE